MGPCCDKIPRGEKELGLLQNSQNLRRSLRKSTKQMDVNPEDHIPQEDYAEKLEIFEPELTTEQIHTLAQSLIRLPNFYELNDGSVYQGTWLCGIPHGKGVFFCEEHIYEGLVQAGRYFGYGRKILRDGEIHQGEFELGEMVTGEIIFPNKHRLFGDFVDGFLEGEGMEIWPDGAVYKGDFVKGVRSGFGKLFYEKFEARKTSKTLCGAIVREFKCQKNEHFSKLMSKKSQIGKANDNQVPASPNKSALSRSSQSRRSSTLSVFNNEIIENFFKKKGEYYEGSWLKGHFHGKGLYHWLDGRYYEGDWVNGMMQGQGAFHWPNGSCYVGSYFKDKKHGFGEFFWPDGRVWRGQWSEGRAIEGKISKDDNFLDENRSKSFRSYLGLYEESFEVTNKNRKNNSNAHFNEKTHHDTSMSILEEHVIPCTDENLFSVPLKARFKHSSTLDEFSKNQVHVLEVEEEDLESGNGHQKRRARGIKHVSLHEKKNPYARFKKFSHHIESANSPTKSKLSETSKFGMNKGGEEEILQRDQYEEFSVIENLQRIHINPTSLAQTENDLFFLNLTEEEEDLPNRSASMEFIEFRSNSNILDIE